MKKCVSKLKIFHNDMIFFKMLQKYICHEFFIILKMFHTIFCFTVVDNISDNVKKRSFKDTHK